MCVSSLRCPACNEDAPYCHLWPVRLYNIFPLYLINGTIFWGKNLLNTKYVIWFSLQLLYKPFLILRRTERDIIINVYWSLCKVPVILARCYSTDCWKTLLSNFTKIRPVVAELFHANGRTWRSL